MDTDRKTVTSLITGSGCQILPNLHRTHRDKRGLYAGESFFSSSFFSSLLITPYSQDPLLLWALSSQGPVSLGLSHRLTVHHPSDPRNSRAISGSLSYPILPSF